MPTDIDATGARLILTHVVSVGVAAAMMCLCYALGRAFIDRLLPEAFVSVPSSILQLALSVTSGCGLLGTWLLLGCAVVGVSRWKLTILLLPVAIGVARAAVPLPQLLRRACTEFAAGVGRSGEIVFVAAVGFMLLHALAPPTDWDTLVYHLDIPKEFFEKGRIHLPADNLHVAFVGVMHMLYLPLMAFGGSTAPAVMNVMWAALLPPTIVAVGSALSVLTGRYAASLVWASTPLLLVGQTARVDTALALVTLLGHGLLVLVLIREGARHALFLSAVCFGVAGGIKYLGLAYALAAGPLLVHTLLAHSQGSERLRRALIYLSIVMICVLPWSVKNTLLLGAPFYPYVSTRQLPEWVQRVSGQTTIPSAVDQNRLRIYRQARTTFNVRDLLLSPGRLTVEPEGVLYFTNWLFPILVIAPLFLRDVRLAWLLVPPLLYGLMVVSMSSLTNVRYFLPAVPALTIAAVDIVRRLTLWLRWSADYVLLAAMIVVLFPAALIGVDMTARFNAAQQAMGLVSTDQYLSAFTLANVDDYWKMIRVIESRSPSRPTLLLFEGRGFYFNAPVIQDNVMANWPMLYELGGASDCRVSRHFEYVLVNTGVVEYFRARGADLHAARWDRFDEFARRCLSVVDETEGFRLYRTKNVP